MSQNNAYRIKRSMFQYLSLFIVMIILYNALIKIEIESLYFFDFVNIILAALILIVFIRAIYLRDYMLIYEDKIKIQNLFLTQNEISRKEIVALQITKNIFAKSFFTLENGQKIKFDTFGLSNQDLQKLKEFTD